MGMGEPVKVGDSKYVHARSAYYDGETRCGLQDRYPLTFQATNEAITCPHCLRAKAA